MTTNRQNWYDSGILVKCTESYEVYQWIIKLCRLGNHLGSILTETDRKGRALLSHRTRLCGPSIAVIANFLQVLPLSGSLGECLHVQKKKKKKKTTKKAIFILYLLSVKGGVMVLGKRPVRGVLQLG